MCKRRSVGESGAATFIRRKFERILDIGLNVYPLEVNHVLLHNGDVCSVKRVEGKQTLELFRAIVKWRSTHHKT